MPDSVLEWMADGSLLVLWGALLFHCLLPIPLSAHPVSLWRAFAQILADKVNTNSSYSQSLLSGSLAWLLMLIPLLAVLVALKPLVWQPALFELALLLLAIDWRNSEKLGHNLANALIKEDKELARSLLKPFLNRETATLSPLGLGKAGAETLILGYARNVVAVLFFYGLFGGIGALLYRFSSELARAWSPSRNHFLPFGLPAVRILVVLDFIPLRLFSLLVVLGKNMSHVLQRTIAESQSWPSKNAIWLLSAVGHKLELSLGGPVIYSAQKTARARIGGRIAPSPLHLDQIQKLLAWRLCIWIVLQSTLMFWFHKGI